MLPQVELTLNLLQKSRIHPKLSANDIINGGYNYNKTPLAPLGTKIIHEKPKQHLSWADHGIKGWYIGPVMLHYRCYRCYLPQSQHKRISDTVEFFPHDIHMPAQSAADKAIQTMQDLIHTINNPTPATPFPTFRPEHTTALQELASIFNTNIDINHTAHHNKH